MSRTLRELEKSLKRIARGESVAADRLAVLWQELGLDGDAVALEMLARPEWEAFARNAAAIPELRPLLGLLVLRPGMTAAALDLLALLDISAPGPDAPSNRALWIFDVAQREDSGDWVRVRDMMLADPRMLEGALLLLETKPSLSAAAFLTDLIRRDLTKEQDQRIRKSLYRMKQHGVSLEAKLQAVSEQKEWYLFAENRLPLWQLAFCFRFHSTFASTGDLYILRILEGREFSPPDQKPDLRLAHSDFVQLGKRYAEQIVRELGLAVQFHSVPAENAHYFLRQSLRMLEGAPGSESLQNLLRFLRAGEGVPPALAPVPGVEGSGGTLLLDHEYFRHWTLDPESFRELSAEWKQMESGTIVLVGAALLEKKREAQSRALHAYFEERRRHLWSHTFLKAAFFLGQSTEAQEAHRISKQFADLSIPIDSLPIVDALFERTMQVLKQEEDRREKEQKESSLIVSPEEFARSRRPPGQS